MKKHVISISRHNLTRCSGCGRHHQIDQTLSSEELLGLDCEFCGSKIIGSSVPTRASGSRTSKIAMGLLSASLAFSACDDDDEVVTDSNAGTEAAGEMAGVEMLPAGDAVPEALYGAPPAGEDFAGEEVAGEMVAGTSGDQPVYGVPPAGEEGE